MSTLANWLPNYKQRYGDFTDPLPEENTLADYFPFIRQDQRPGIAFNVPIVVSLEHGQTANVDGTAFALNSAVDSVLQNAQIDGATLALIGNIPYDVSFKSRNGAGNGSNGGAFRTAFELKTDLLMKSMEFYREISLLYGCGTASTITADLGVVFSVTGTNLNGAAGMQVTFTTPTWAPGMWTNMIGAKVDFMNAGGTATVANATGVRVAAVNADTKTVQFINDAGGGGVAATGQRIIPTGWFQKSCVGTEAILQNQGTLFNINAATYPLWKSLQIDLAGTTLGRAKILGIMARLFPNGLTQGGKLFVCGPTFADLAEEADLLQRFTGNTDEVKRQGANNLQYKSPAGTVDVALHKYMKQGEAMFFPAGNGKRVGSTDITFRGEGDDWFFLELPSNAGCQLRTLSNQAPFLTMPFRCAYIKNITNSTSSGQIGTILAS